jgi:hypothetical protein
MRKFEYASFKGFEDEDRTTNYLLIAGKDGWELVSVTPIETVAFGRVKLLFYFKREIFVNQ